MIRSNLSAKLHSQFREQAPAAALEAFARLRAIVEDQRYHLYLVGGGVRDLLLGRLSLDIDFAVQGDAPTVGRLLAEQLGLRHLTHAAFHTATVYGHGFTFDIAMTRREEYMKPGALPVVHAADISADLARRDFTINAMALGIYPEEGLIDPFGGQADLQQGLVRALHDRSFQDDATRILRAARYCARLGFRLEKRTLAWLLRDKGYLNSISGERVRYDFLRILEEERPELALSQLAEMAVLAEVSPALRFDTAMAARFACAREEASDEVTTDLYLALLAWAMDESAISSLARRLSLPRRQAEVALATVRLKSAAAQIADGPLTSGQAADLLSAQPATAVWALALGSTGLLAARTLHYLREARRKTPILSGEDVLRLGAPKGPQVGRILRELRIACIDGRVQSRQDEEQLVLQLLQKEQP